MQKQTPSNLKDKTDETVSEVKPKHSHNRTAKPRNTLPISAAMDMPALGT